MRFARAAALACLVLATIWPSAGALGQVDNGWRTIQQERGITVSARDEAGSDMLSFRGQGKVKGLVLHVLAILLDDAHSPEWAKNADESKLLRTIDAYTQIVYSRSDQTWPVRDRDLVMKRTIEVLKPAEAFRVRLVCIAGEKPALPSVVRIQRCDTSFVLRQLDDTTTFVDYRVRVDPGAGNPQWLVRMATKSNPFETLIGLRQQVAKTKRKYEAVMREWANRAS
jgi:hypothetical protein